MSALAAAALMAALAGGRMATPEECAVMASTVHSQFLNPRGVTPLHLAAHVAARAAAPSALIAAEELGQYYRDYFPQLPRPEADDLAAVAAARTGDYDIACDWAALGVAFTGSASTLVLEEPVISSDHRYAIESARYDSEALGTGGVDCLLEDHDGRWTMTVCRPAAGIDR